MKTVIITLFTALSALGQSWYNNSWQYRQMSSVTSPRVLGAPPLLVSLPSSITSHSRSDCHDIRVTQSDGTTLLQWAYDTQDSCTSIWVGGALTVGATDSIIFIYTGNPAASDGSNPSSVWAAYSNVYHFSGDLTDSSGNSRTCTKPQGSNKYATGIVGQSFLFNRGTYLSCPTLSTFASGYTVEFTMKLPATRQSGMSSTALATQAFAFFWEYAGQGWYQNGGSDIVHGRFSSPTYMNWINPDVWTHIVATYTGGTVSVYWNGILFGSVSQGAPQTPVGNIILGANTGANSGSPDCSSPICLQAYMDEVRISSTAMSAGYIMTQSQQLLHGSEATYGTLETQPAASPVVTAFTTSQEYIIPGESARLGWRISNKPTSVSIDNGVGSQSALLSGGVAVSPSSTTTYTLTASNGTGVITSSVTVNVIARGLRWHTQAPGNTAVIAYSNTTPPVINISPGMSPNYQIGQHIRVFGLCADDSSRDYGSNLNSPTVLKITGMNSLGDLIVSTSTGGSITPNAAFGSVSYGSQGPCSGNVDNPANPGPIWMEVVTLLPINVGPKAFLDGWNGTLTRKLSTSTNNGLVSLVVSGGTATATYSYTVDSLTTTGTTFTVNGTVSGALNGEKTLTGVTSNSVSFSTAAGDGDYTVNPSCLPSSTDNCVTTSFLAYASNPVWQRAKNVVNTWSNPNNYKSIFDGGNLLVTGYDFPSTFATGAMVALVEKQNTDAINGLVSGCNHIERMVGVNWVANETQGDGGNGITAWPDAMQYGAGPMVDVCKIYQTPTQLAATIGKLANNTYPATANASTCNKVLPHPQGSEILLTGTAQAGGSTTSIVFPASASAVNDFYKNYAVIVKTSPQRIGLITGYNGTTKVGTVQTTSPYSTWSAAPDGQVFEVWATGTYDGAGHVIGYGTQFTSWISSGNGVLPLGDGLILNIGWTTLVNESTKYVTGVVDDEHVNVIPSSFNSAITTPVPLFWIKGWNTGDCGWAWLQYHNAGAYNTQPPQYPTTASTLSSSASALGFSQPVVDDNKGSVALNAFMAVGLSLVDDTPLAEPMISWAQSVNHDYQWAWGVSSQGAPFFDGIGYSYQSIFQIGNYMRLASRASTKMPSLVPSGNYIQNLSALNIHIWLPDQRNNPSLGCNSNSCIFKTWWGNGAQAGYQIAAANSPGASGQSQNTYLTNPAPAFNPTTTPSQQLKNFAVSRSNYNTATIGSTNLMMNLIDLDPRITSTDYTTMLRQKAFLSTDYSTCTFLSDTLCPPNFYSNSLWSKTSTWSDKSATALSFYAWGWSGGAYNMRGTGILGVYRVGQLIGCDRAPYGPGLESNLDPTNLCDVLQINGGSSSLKEAGSLGSMSYAFFDRCSDSDSQNRYAYCRADLRGSYNILLNAANREITHLKKSGTEEIIFDRYRVDASNYPAATTLTAHTHYGQNGQAATNNLDTPAAYDEGTTQCPGGGGVGCPSLNTSRAIESCENNAAADTNPARQYCVLTKTVAAAGTTIFWRWDGTTYPGTAGNTNRVSFCAGSSCGATVTGMDFIIVHKISTLPDVTLTVAPLIDSSGGANWVIAQTIDKVGAFARGGDQTTLSVTTTFSGTAAHLIAGLDSSMTYDVSLGASIILSNVSVSPSNNTLYFETTAGSLTIAPHNTNSGGSSIQGKTSISGNTVIH